MAGFTQTAETPPLGGRIAGQNVIPLAAYTATGSCEFNVDDNLVSMVEAHFIQTSGTAGQSLLLSIDGWNEANNTWEAIITSAALTQTTTDDKVVSVNPMTASVTNVSAQRALRRRMRVTVTHADTKSVTYGVDVHTS